MIAWCYHNNKFKVATTPNTTTLEYYQSIYTHCKQRFNISDEIEVVKKSVYQYIENCINNYLFRNYNISEVRSNLYNNLVHYSQLGTEDLNSETLATYFQELNFNIIEYCEKKYPVQPKYSFNFESETKTSNKDKQKVKQYLRTTPNTSILPKTTAKHFVKLLLSITLFLILLVQPQTPSSLLNRFSRPEDFQSPRNPIQQQEPISTSANIIDYLQENKSNHSESLKIEETKSEPEEIIRNKEEMTTVYIVKIPEFTGEDNDTSPQKWLDKVQKAEDANAGLKDKLIKKVHLHVPTDLATAIRHAKNYEMAIKEANHTKLVNLAIGETSSAAEEKIDQLTKKVESYFTNQQQQQQQPQRYQPSQRHNQNYFGSPSYNQPQNYCKKLQRDQQNRSNQRYSSPQQSYYQSSPPTYYLPRPQIKTVIINQLHNQYSNNISNHYQFSHIRYHPLNNIKYQQEDCYLTIPEKSDFQQPALSENEVAALRSNPSNNTISPAQIAQNANLLDIFPFEFKANESPFLLSNTAANEQRAIIAITVDRPAQTVIVTANNIKKTPVGEIDNFLFTIDKITILVKVLVMDALQYQALVGNDWLLKANANLDWETQELKISYQEQYTIVLATCGTFNKQSEKAPIFEFEKKKKMSFTKIYMAFRSISNWAEETKQKIFEELRG
ncbi:hypothetical protein G9A89_012531 [Geosiphon pyriformis]|nr:hypothetical protein G9A89_012531 [Geosiphon pyriformis]